MSRKVIKYFFELVFIFVIPLLIICLNCNYSNIIEYDNNGNYQATEKHIEFTPPFSYVRDDYYINYLDFNQLIPSNERSISLGFYDIILDNEKWIISGTDTISHGYWLCNHNLIIGHKYILINYSNNINLPIYIGPYSNRTNDYLFFTINNSNIEEYSFSGVYVIDNITYNNDIIQYSIIDLTKMFGSGYEPSTINELNNYIDLSTYHNQTESEIIDFESNSIISDNYRINYTIWGRIKYSFIQGLELQDDIVLDIVISYTILWFTMFLIWHIIYLLFDKLFHLRRE